MAEEDVQRVTAQQERNAPLAKRFPLSERLKEVWTRLRKKPEEAIEIQNKLPPKEKREGVEAFLETGLQHMRDGNYHLAIQHLSNTEQAEQFGIISSTPKIIMFGPAAFSTEALTTYCLDCVAHGGMSYAQTKIEGTDNSSFDDDLYFFRLPFLVYCKENSGDTGPIATVLTNSDQEYALYVAENQLQKKAETGREVEIFDFANDQAVSMLPDDVMHAISEIYAEEYIHVLQKMKGRDQGNFSTHGETIFTSPVNLSRRDDIDSETDVALFLMQQGVPLTRYFMREGRYARKSKLEKVGVVLEETENGYLLAEQ